MKLFMILLQTVFITLKLAKVITWSWWFVFSPAILALVIVIGFFGFMALVFKAN